MHERSDDDKENSMSEYHMRRAIKEFSLPKYPTDSKKKAARKEKIMFFSYTACV